jgi:hypothetical protein
MGITGFFGYFCGSFTIELEQAKQRQIEHPIGVQLFTLYTTAYRDRFSRVITHMLQSDGVLMRE